MGACLLHAFEDRMKAGAGQYEMRIRSEVDSAGL